MADFCSGPPSSTRVAPQDNGAFFQQYYRYIVQLVKRNGIHESEDVAMEIFTRFIETDRLGKYDPTMTHTYDGKEHTAAFSTYIRALVHLYCRSHRERQTIRTGRELLICDAVVDVSGETWVERHGQYEPSHEDSVLSHLSNAELVEYLRSHMREVPRRSHRDLCDLGKFFDAWVRQILKYGATNNKELAEEFQTCTSSVRAWLRHMHGQIVIALANRG